MRKLVALLVLPLVLFTACDLVGPDALPGDRFGAIVALVRGNSWESDLRLDSVIAYYDARTGRLTIFGNRQDGDRTAGLSLNVCGPPEPRAYYMASFWSGPYGPERLALGAEGRWWQTNGPNPSGFTSAGDAGDSLVVEEFDLNRLVIRGSFRFRALNLTGKVELAARGRFWGRVQIHGGRCSLDAP